MVCSGQFFTRVAAIILLQTTDVKSFPSPARSARKLNSLNHGNIPVHVKLCASKCISQGDDTIAIGIPGPHDIDSYIAVNTDEAVSSRRHFMTSCLAGTAVVTTATAAIITPTKAGAADVDLSSEMLAADVAVDWEGIFKKASRKALGGGKAGAAAAVVQVCSLMWLRTAMNYQYRYGGDLKSSLNTLWEQGGLPRLYQGLPFALVQGPLTRFGDTAANVGILAFLESFEATASLPLPLRTACGSIAAGAWRIVLMPVDTSKTAMQVEGADGLERLRGKIQQDGPSALYQGALASAAATAVGHFPWFLTYNFLNNALPAVSASDDLLLSLARAALCGLCSSCVSDISSNSLRVIKTTKQTAGLGEGSSEISYKEAVNLILEDDGWQGLFVRGLQTRLLTNAIQGATFSVLWKYFQQVG